MEIREISALIGEVVAAQGAELVDFQCGGSRRKPVVKVFVDVPGGTTVEACAELSRRIEARLEGSGLLGERYTLEVSSPGLDRPLRTRRDFTRMLGRSVAVRMRGELGGRGELVGVLQEVGGEDKAYWIVLRDVGGRPELRVSGEQIASAKPHIPW